MLIALMAASAPRASIPRSLSIRRYEPSDQRRLEELCAGVYGGTDYLPRIAPALCSDESCAFLAGFNGGLVLGLGDAL